MYGNLKKKKLTAFLSKCRNLFATDDGDVVVAVFVFVERRRRQTSLTFSFHFVGIIYLRCGCSRRRRRCCFRCYNTSFVCYFRLIALLSAQQI